MTFPLQGMAAAATTNWATTIAEARRRVPAALPKGWTAKATVTATGFDIDIAAPKPLVSPLFFSIDEGVIEEAAAPVVTPTARGTRLSLKKSELLTTTPTVLHGVLTLGDGTSYESGDAPRRPCGTSPEPSMTIRRITAALALATLGVTAVSLDAARAGETAPSFTAVDSNGRTHNLADYTGKFVVLEWHNQGCSYVKKHYGGNMQKLQKEWTARGVVWLTVISSAVGQQGYVTPAEANAYVKDKGAAPSAVLLDPKGIVGNLYGAKTTPHLYVISPDGTLLYDGAIDSKPTADVDDIATATNYLSAALTEAMAGKAVTTAMTKPYGCSVKYAAGPSL